VANPETCLPATVSEPADTGRWPCWIDVDLDGVAANVQTLRKWIGPGVALCAVVKAQGYGLGAELVATAALAAGADALAVARVHEGVRLRRHGVTAPILLLTGFAPAEADDIVRHTLTPTVVAQDQVSRLAACAQRTGRKLAVHVKMDTGLHRYGASTGEAVSLASRIYETEGLELEGFYTHFATADAADLSFAHEQLGEFRGACAYLADRGMRPRYLHAANSAATLGLREAHFDFVRVGLAVYGYYATPTVARSIELRPAATLRARVARVLSLPPGCTVGYGRTYRTTREMRAALLTIGYADGLPGSHYRGGYVLLGGQRADFIGRISMDQCVVDITQCPDVQPGDCAVVLGQQGDDTIDLDQYAELSGSIPHESLASLGGRVPRVYWRDGKTVAVATLAGPEPLAGWGLPTG
jgi:alanine racemase